MRILFLTKYYPPSEGGIERYGYILCTELAKRGVHVEVIAACEDNSTPRVEVVESVRVYRLKNCFSVSATPISLKLPPLLWKLLPDFDLLHLNFPNPWTDLVYLLFCQHKRAILTYHGDIFRQKGTIGSGLLKAYNPCIHYLLRQVSAVIATSPNCVDNSPFLFRQKGRCSIIPMPVDLSSFGAVDQLVVRAIQRQYGEFVLFVGRLVPYKGLRYLIEAISLLSGINLVVIGRGPLENTLRTQVDRLGLGSRVFFLGKVPDEKLKDFYYACQCFVLPSINHAEAFGIVLAEAMACGKPVISTELSTGTSFVNQDGETGFVVPPRDPSALAEKIDLLTRDSVLREKFGRQARTRAAQKFGKEIVVEKTLQLYENVLAR